MEYARDISNDVDRHFLAQEIENQSIDYRGRYNPRPMRSSSPSRVVISSPVIETRVLTAPI